MLQRATSNAYSWWWASQIRTKQSKWLVNDLQEMEDRVKLMIKLIDEDADSFAKKAEMYFRRRPELINIVEETFRAYKALADRYDRISGELHNANHTIATAFPDQVPMLEDDDDFSVDLTKLATPPPNLKLPKPPAELPRHASRTKARTEAPKLPPQHRRTDSQMTPEQAKQEIDRLQKRILGLQTEKEFCKSSYESGLAKYWDIERQVTELQREISHLQDEFINVGSVIEDDEARALVAATALKSCEDSLVRLHAKQKESSKEATMESERISVAKLKLKFLKGEETGDMSDTTTSSTTMTEITEEEYEGLKHDRFELQSICDKVKDLFDMSSETAVADLAEKIDQLVEKVINLEITVSSQSAQIQTLRAEIDELQKHLRDVEEEKSRVSNVDPNNLNQRLTQVEEQLKRILDLEKNVQNEKVAVQTHFAEACSTLNHLSETLQSPDQTNCFTSSASTIEGKVSNLVTKIETKEIISESKSQPEDDLHIPDWEKLLANGLEGKDKVLLYEYISILRNYKDTRKKLAEMDKNHQEYQSETTQQIQELRCENAIKDEEIKTLRKKLFASDQSMRKSSAILAEEVMVDALDTEHAEDEDPLVEEELKMRNAGEPCTPSPMEEKFRVDIDTLLEENLDFWLRFSTSYHQIQKFSSAFKDLKEEAEKYLENKNTDGGDDSGEQVGRPESSPPDKKLREFNTELQVWLEQNRLLQGELQCRFASLCSIQEEITRVTKCDNGEDVKFTPYQAAKFQGEVINMQGENNKVAKELQTGLDHVKLLQSEVTKTISKLHEKLELSTRTQPQYNQFRHVTTKSIIPLKTFLFAAKVKKHSKHSKHSIFAFMNPMSHHHKHHDETNPDEESKPPQ